jgi:cation diffusion facilitator family transporter
VSKPGADPQKTVKAALLANAGIACAKLVAAVLSGSAAMLAEAVHSVADTSNQALLRLGMRRARRPPTALHPFGSDRESYFWAFIVSLLLFFVGGVFAVYEGAHKLAHHKEHAGSLLVPLIVLGISVALELTSFTIALREFNKSRGAQPIARALFSGKDPVIPLVLLEDTGAVVGLLIALVSIATTAITGRAAADAIGSILIGVLLCAIGLLLAKDTHSLLIGEAIDTATRAEVVRIAEHTRGVLGVSQLLSLHLGPDAVLLALKVRFQPTLAVPEVERTINDLEARLRGQLPILRRIFVEPDSAYEPARDPDYPG